MNNATVRKDFLRKKVTDRTQLLHCRTTKIAFI